MTHPNLSCLSRRRSEVRDLRLSQIAHESAVALLTGGGDKPYAFGLATSLLAKGVAFDLIGSDDLDFPECRGNPRMNFLNLRGDQQPDASLARKVIRVGVYYARLIRYAATSRPRVFHILWNNKLQFFDRTLLMLYYKLLGKRILLTLHNVNAGKRDGNDSFLNRLTLRIQYGLAHHIFVHTQKMKLELIEEFGVNAPQVTVIPFGINNAVPDTGLTATEAKQRLGVRDHDRTILFFGNITPYKGLEHLATAFHQLLHRSDHYRLIIAGKPVRCEEYWSKIDQTIREDVKRGRILLRAEFIPDEETEVYFKASDVLVLPYRHIYQSGVLFLAQSFGLPVVASDVGSLREDIIGGKTGFLCTACDPDDLARTIEKYFESDLYRNLGAQRQQIRDYANARHSWHVVAEMTVGVYAELLGVAGSGAVPATLSSSPVPRRLKKASAAVHALAPLRTGSLSGEREKPVSNILPLGCGGQSGAKQAAEKV